MCTYLWVQRQTHSLYIALLTDVPDLGHVSLYLLGEFSWLARTGINSNEIMPAELLTLSLQNPENVPSFKVIVSALSKVMRPYY